MEPNSSSERRRSPTWKKICNHYSPRLSGKEKGCIKNLDHCKFLIQPFFRNKRPFLLVHQIVFERSKLFRHRYAFLFASHESLQFGRYATLFFSPLMKACNLAGISTSSPMIFSTVSLNLAGWAVSRKIPVSPGFNPSDKAR